MWKRVFDAQTLMHGAQVLSLVAACLAIFGQTQIIAAFIIAIAVAAYISHIVIRHRAQRQMKSRLDELASAVDIDHIVRGTAEVLGLGSQGQGWRLSLYRLELGENPDDGWWMLLARAANQATFERSRDFERLTLRQGVLRVAVNSASSPTGGIDDIPPLPDPESDPEAWNSMMTVWGMGDHVGGNGMRSRVYCGRVFRVGLGRGHERDMTLALVAESESPTGVRKQLMEEALTRPVFELFYELLRLREDMRHSLEAIAP